MYTASPLFLRVLYLWIQPTTDRKQVKISWFCCTCTDFSFLSLLPKTVTIDYMEFAWDWVI